MYILLLLKLTLNWFYDFYGVYSFKTFIAIIKICIKLSCVNLNLNNNKNEQLLKLYFCN